MKSNLAIAGMASLLLIGGVAIAQDYGTTDTSADTTAASEPKSNDAMGGASDDASTGTTGAGAVEQAGERG